MEFGPIAFSFAAGMVATVNPCGFAMLPAYLALFLTDSNADLAGHSGVRSGLRVGLVVTVAFVATFSVVGVVFNLVSTSIVNFIPWAALVVGMVLAAAGVAVVLGRHLPIRSVQLGFTKNGSVRSIALFGVAYAVASVSCTLPIFLSVATFSIAANDPAQGVGVFTAYGLGMGAILVALAVGVATSRDAIVLHMRRLMPYVERIGGWLLLASGLFIVYYWTTLLTVDVTRDSSLLGPILRVERVSAWFTNQIVNNTLWWLAGLVAIVVVIGAFEVMRKRRDTTRLSQ